MKTKITTLLFIFGMIIKSQATTVTVKILSSSFSPNSITVNVGDTVLWMWETNFHSSTSTSVPVSANAWDSGTLNSGATFKYVVSVAGEYKYKCTPHGFTGSITATTPTGLKEDDLKQNQIVFYPNPATNFIYVSSNENFKVFQCAIYDLTGKIVNRVISTSSSHELIDLADLSLGMYWIELRNESGRRNVFPFVKK